MKKWKVCLFVLVVMLIAGYFIWNNDDGKQREIRIVQEYQAIKHPEGAKLVSYEVGRKVIMRWIRSKYIYPISDDEIKKYYDQEFQKRGWRKISYNYSRPGNISYAYEKENLKVVLRSYKEGNYWILYMTYADAKY